MAEGQEEPLRRRLCEQGPEHREGRPGTTPGRALELFTGRGTARAQGLSWANRKLAIRKWTVQGNLVHSVLCNHYLCVVPNIFISEKETLYLLSSHSLFSPLPQPVATTNSSSVSIDLLILDISHVWNDTVCAFCDWLLLHSIMFSCINISFLFMVG